MSSLVDSLRAVEADLGGGTLGVAAAHQGETVLYNADVTFPTASVIKAAIVAELHLQVEEGRLSPDAPVTVEAADVVAGSGVLCRLTPGLSLPLRDLALLAIMVSDNTASNLCLRAVGGPEAVNRRMHQEWGMPDTTIHRPIRFALGPDDPPHTATGTPRDMMHFMDGLAQGTLLPEPARDAVLGLLETTTDASMLPRYLGVNPYAPELRADAPPVTVLHKTGAVSGVRNDAGILRRGGSGGSANDIAVCVYTKGVADDRWTPANAGSEAVARVARLLRDHFWGHDA